MKFVDKKYNFLKAVKTPNLVRLGRKNDGGYVADSEIVKQCNTLITFGLGPDWTFELDYIKKNKEIEIYVYDHTVSIYPYIKEVIKYFRRFMTFRATFRSVASRINNLSNYRSFLNLKNVHYFKEKITYPIKDKIDTDVEKAFSRVDKSRDVVLKCDIEGDEYKIIDEILKYSPRIKMLIFEFHLANNNEENFHRDIKKIQEYFEIIHIHGNNHFPKFNSGLPPLLEITLINKKFAPKNPEYIYNYPIQDLDYPNNPYKDDLVFSFEK